LSSDKSLETSVRSSLNHRVVLVDNVSKCYNIFNRPVDRIKSLLSGGRFGAPATHFALHPLSFEIKSGEVVGIIGKNGSGKSTLLQLVSRTTPPTTGSIVVKGRCSAILELGSGFNPEFTGRENVLLNAALLGLSAYEIRQKLDSIIEFADIGEFIDYPVKLYSSGMQMRLGFAVATSVDPDVLIIDEALSVGDGAFAKKSFDRILGIKERGASILFCSHVLFHIDVFCSRVLWLDAGRLVADGPPSQVLPRYQEFLDGVDEPSGSSKFLKLAANSEALAGQPEIPSSDALPPEGRNTASVKKSESHAKLINVSLSVDGVEGSVVEGFSRDSSLELHVRFFCDLVRPAPTLAIVVSSAQGRILATCSSLTQHIELNRDARGLGFARFVCPGLPLKKGTYRIGIYLMCELGIHVYEWVDPFAMLEVQQRDIEQGYFVLNGEWTSEAPSGK
jgi:lipopolysaccharide transport system ATP-binding protein